MERSIMGNPYKIALAEVDSILSYTDSKILEKIPKSFQQFVKENKEKDYTVTIHKGVSLEQQNISKEAKAILALLYRDYICDKEERKRLIEEENKEKKIIEQQKHEKYAIDFEKRKENNHEEKEEINLMPILSKDKWYKKIIQKLKRILYRKDK